MGALCVLAACTPGTAPSTDTSFVPSLAAPTFDLATDTPGLRQLPTAAPSPATTEVPSYACSAPPTGQLEQFPEPIGEFVNAGIATFQTDQDLSELVEGYEDRGATVRIALADLNSDLIDDLILGVVLPREDPMAPGGFVGAFILSSCADGELDLVPISGNESAYECMADWCSYRILVSDLAGLGAPQVLVVLEEGYVNWSYPTIEVIGWQAGGWATYMNMPLEIGPLYSLAVDDADGDGTSEISLWGFRLGTTALEISRPVYQQFRWKADSAQFILAVSEPLPSPYRFQVLEDAQRAIDSGDTHLAIALYLAAIHGSYIDIPSFGQRQIIAQTSDDPLDLKELAHAYQTAFAHFRLIYLYELIGQPEDADRMLRQLRNLHPVGTPGSEFAELAIAMLDRSRQDIPLSISCIEAVDITVTTYPDLAGFNGHIGDWGNTNVRYTEDTLCPAP